MEQKKCVSGYHYVYQYKDHLGNVRLSYADNNGTLEIIEENNYYPFGLKHKGYNANISSNGNSSAQKYKYNGKELNEELGLNMYDYGARFYDPATGRWFTPDALAEQYYDQSTYTYTLNNPIIYVDPDGNQVEMCCDSLKGFLAASVDNVVGSNLRGYFDTGSDSYRTGVKSANMTSLVVGTALTIDGAASTLAGGSGLVASGAVAATGVGAPVGGIGAAGSGALTVKGLAETALGINIMHNAINNMKADANNGNGSSQKFDGGNDTNSKSSNEAFRNAKDQNGVPRSQQPDKTTTVREKGTGKELKQYEFTNSKGEKVKIRKDNPRTYSDGGSQGNHYNAGKKEKLKQHHNYDN